MRFASWKCIGVRRWWSVMNNATTRNLLPNSNWVNLAWCRQRFLRYSRFLLILSSALHFSRPQLFLTFSRCCRNLLFSILILYFSFFSNCYIFSLRIFSDQLWTYFYFKLSTFFFLSLPFLNLQFVFFCFYSFVFRPHSSYFTSSILF